MTQRSLFDADERPQVALLRRQLLKWIGNKQRFAPQIIASFPRSIATYFEPFLGSGGVLGTLSPQKAVASDIFGPLIEIWKALHDEPSTLERWYADRWEAAAKGNKVDEYERIKASYNRGPNGADLVFLCRACYGGVVRFRQADGYMSTPCGIHRPISPHAFAKRVGDWHRRTRGTTFLRADFEETMDRAQRGDLIYCDPPYADSQRILYGAQAFSVEHLFRTIERCKARGANVALSIDGIKKSGDKVCDVTIPAGLFEREILVNCGRSMLRRFQMGGRTLESEVVADRLLLTY